MKALRYNPGIISDRTLRKEEGLEGGKNRPLLKDEPHKTANMEPLLYLSKWQFIWFNPILNARPDTYYMLSQLILIMML